MAPLLRSFAAFLLEFVHCLPATSLSAIGEVANLLSSVMKTKRMDFGQNYYQKDVHCRPASSLFTIGEEVNELNRKNQLSGLKDEDLVKVLAHLAHRRGTSSLEATISTGPWHHC
ncbi:hypothetical protein RHMOL_Rhmol12G0112100 [Rhododendron molle]|uniref:Uncharacterized protein n=1 Tax=Rhododendron molle TaxID=49168 RepID=A0ACC0LH83_RHOML|nr:hypothetical protein RHMOL_Rhmol12G0112100 [Rhododendron molle]